MPRSESRPWKKRKEPVLDHLVHQSVAQSSGKTDEKGRYGEVHYVGCETRERAQEIRQAAFRAKRYTGYSVSATAKQDADGTWRVVIMAVDPAYAKKYVIEKYGTDRTKWPYSGRRGDPNYQGGATP